MKHRGWMFAVALITIGTAQAAKADVVVDQSRIWAAAPALPLIEQASWSGLKWRLLNE